MMEAFDVELGKLKPAYTEIRDFFCNRALLVRAVYLQGQEALSDIAANGSTISIFLPTVEGFMVSMRLPRLWTCVDSVIWKN